MRELANEVWLYVFLNLDKFDDPGSAKLSTRLFGLARQHTRNWRTKQQNRLAAVSRRMAAGRGFVDIEVLSDAELAEMRSVEKEQIAA